ncbi:bifunctional tetrahydrofolate synthase/dihydrofolate synthase [Luteimonas saliphila]|uniref:bifunctional tetrahydrofolate synthase/dihydrofolate synthase n=1 Tax=Luteimonas saliphila TaxID=2804919 RepID=UPI00192DA05E|nr:bifunctional tetrahydrofolate synthase/dihydrofolate synthase [Luteimonas saliphila]
MPTTLSDWLAHIERQHPADTDLGLERVRRVAARLGLARPARRVVTIAGTNGKGSTVAFVEAIAREAGLRVGAYTSPHLLAYNERVRIDGRDADDASLAEAFAAVEAARGDMPLTYFEFGTLAALWLFARAALDLAVLEVGLGGRLDATNLVDADVAVVTTVDLDHQDWLGGDREAIGAEKAGIARAWKPLVVGDDDPPASVLRHAYAIGASAIRAGSDFFFERVDDARWRWHELDYALELPLPGLSAPVQLRNAAVAIAALRALDIDVPADAIARGVASARLPGRLQRFAREGVAVFVDVGHNPQAARELAAWLRATPAAGRTHAVYAALGDKDAGSVVEAFESLVDAWWLGGSLGAGARGIAVAVLAERLRQSVASASHASPDPAAALAAALRASTPGDRVLVFGSFHAAESALRALHGAGSEAGADGGV